MPTTPGWVNALACCRWRRSASVAALSTSRFAEQPDDDAPAAGDLDALDDLAAGADAEDPAEDDVGDLLAVVHGGFVGQQLLAVARATGELAIVEATAFETEIQARPASGSAR
jgi:hypothetical protein